MLRRYIVISLGINALGDSLSSSHWQRNLESRKVFSQRYPSCFSSLSFDFSRKRFLSRYHHSAIRLLLHFQPQVNVS